MVDLHRLQGRLDARAQPLAARVPRPVGARVDAALGRDDHRVPVAVQLAAQRVGQDLLGLAEPVGLGGVEEVHTQVEGVADRPLRLVGVVGTPLARDLPGAERDPRHLQLGLAQSRHLHPVAYPLPRRLNDGRIVGHLTPGPRSGTLGAVRILVTALGAPGHAFPLVPLATALRDAGHEVTFAAGPDVLDGVASTGLATLPAGGGLVDGFGVARERLGVMTWPPDRATEWALAKEVFGDILPRRVVADLAPWLARAPSGPRGGRDRQPGRGPRGGGRGHPVRAARRRPAPDPAGTDVPPRSRAGARPRRGARARPRGGNAPRSRLPRHLPALAPGAARGGRADRAPAAPDRVEPARPGIVAACVRPTVGLPHARHRDGRRPRRPADGRRRARRSRPRRARGRRLGRGRRRSTGWPSDRVRVEPFVAQAELLASDHPPGARGPPRRQRDDARGRRGRDPAALPPAGRRPVLQRRRRHRGRRGRHPRVPGRGHRGGGRADRRRARPRVGTGARVRDRRDAVPRRRRGGRRGAGVSPRCRPRAGRGAPRAGRSGSSRRRRC